MTFSPNTCPSQNPDRRIPDLTARWPQKGVNDFDLQPGDVEWMRSQVRQALRKSFRTDRAMQSRPFYDSAVFERKRAYLEGLYERLGGDPSRISNYAHPMP